MKHSRTLDLLGEVPEAPRGMRRQEPIRACDALLRLPHALQPFADRLHLGTSSWSFSGWRHIVWADDYPESRLSREGLGAYSRHPLLGSVGIDRSFYAPLDLAEYARMASQVPEGFRFLVKAPASITDAVHRDSSGRGLTDNAGFLDPVLANDLFISPCTQGLGDRAGVLLFQFSPLPRKWLSQVVTLVGRLERFLQALPQGPVYAVEWRDPEMLTPRMVRMLAGVGVRLTLGIHDRMPDAQRQARAIEALQQWQPGPLVMRWNLHAGQKYLSAKARYEPFDQLVDPDPFTRHELADLAVQALGLNQPVFLIINNKAEGSAPLSVQAFAQALAERMG